MLKQIIAQNFKCFKDETRIDLGQINLLTGINGRGKSTALQTLLLMHQSLEHSRTTDKLVFNGSCLELGNFDDVRNAETSRSEDIRTTFRFEDKNSHISLQYYFGEDEADDMSAKIQRAMFGGHINKRNWNLGIKLSSGGYIVDKDPKKRPVFPRNFLFENDSAPPELLKFAKKVANFTHIHYVSADRIGPKDYYPKQSFTEFPNVGRQGEYTPNILFQKRSDLVAEDICLESGETFTLLDQAQAWLSDIFDGARVELTPTDANIVLMTLNSEDATSGFKPINVGFGYSYALPIIVAGLIAQPGEILIVENPEAHLHPYAQSQITKFLARVSATGVQVFIESHSDHVLNALRICILDEIVENDDLYILYFGMGEKPEIIRIPVKEDGAIELWPEGFFDQIDKDFSRLFGL